MKIISLALCLSTVMLAAGTTTRKVVDPAAVLNRYVAVTGGAKAYRNCSVEIVDTTVTPEHGESYGVTIFRSRDGKLRTEIDAADASGQMGIFKDTAWVFSNSKGVRTLTGAAARVGVSPGIYTGHVAEGLSFRNR